MPTDASQVTGSPRLALITGAGGGIGRACAFRLARDHGLFLTDIDGETLSQAEADLTRDGNVVVGRAAVDFSAPGAAAEIVASARGIGQIGVVVNAAGLSPSLGNAATILRANVIGTESLLAALEQALEPGLVAILIASMAAHLVAPDEAIDELCRNALAEGLVESVLPLLDAHSPGRPGDSAYNYSKRANVLSVMRRGAAWGAQGARIVSISPGLVDTRMGRLEAAPGTAAAQLLAMTPLGWVQPSDIASAVAFLASHEAARITGCDLKVDSGITGVLSSGSVHATSP